MKPIEISKNVFAHLEDIVPNGQVYHYFGIMGLLGALKTAEAANDQELMDHCIALLKRFPDDIKHAQYNFPSYTCGGIARAYALFKGYMTDEETVRLVKFYAEEIMTAPRDPEGIIKGPHEKVRNLIWIDNAMAVTPFLLYAGLYFNNQEWIDEAVKQTLMMYDVFMDPSCGLLHQTRDEIAPGVISEDHWGRGNGWGYIAITELVQFLPKDHPMKVTVDRYYGRHSFAILKQQSDHYVWRQQMDDPNAYEECTGTGIFLYGYGVGLRLGYLNQKAFKEAFVQGVHNMVKYFVGPEYELYGVCPGCRTPGEGKRMGMPIAYSTHLPVLDDLHGAGPVELALAEAHIAGIEDIEIYDIKRSWAGSAPKKN